MSDNIRIYTYKQKEAYYAYLNKRSEIIAVEQESVNLLNRYYELLRLPMKIYMSAINKDLVDNQILDLKIPKSMSPLLGRTINADATVCYDIKFVTPIRSAIEDIRHYLGSDIDDCIRVKRVKSGRRMFVLQLKNVDDQAVIDDVFDALYYASSQAITHRMNNRG
jgi:hypothetical protein